MPNADTNALIFGATLSAYAEAAHLACIGVGARAYRPVPVKTVVASFIQ